MTDPIPFWLIRQKFDAAIPVTRLTEHPENYNVGDLESIAASLDQHGFYGAVLVQQSTGRIVAGNHRYRAAAAKGAETIPGFWLDIDDDEARQILADDNHTTHLATFDEEKLIRLLTHAKDSPRGFPATYSEDDFADLMQAYSPPELEDLARNAPPEEALWPLLRFRVSPEDRERFYSLTDDAGDRTDEGRFAHLLHMAGQSEQAG